MKLPKAPFERTRRVHGEQYIGVDSYFDHEAAKRIAKIVRNASYPCVLNKDTSMGVTHLFVKENEVAQALPVIQRAEAYVFRREDAA